MRLRAKTDLTYLGVARQPGALFDAVDSDGLDLISRDLASPFNLEDPSTRPTVEEMIAQLPDVPPVRIDPSGAWPDSSGGPATFSVFITGVGLSLTWTVTVDASADWLTIVSPTTPQSVDGAVNYNVAANVGAPRAANMYVNGETFTVTQGPGGGPPAAPGAAKRKSEWPN